MSTEISTTQRYLVFISHSTKDRWIARQMASLIRRRGKKDGVEIATYLDEKDIDVGDSISDSIRVSIRDCSEFLILLSQSSLTRPWVLIELGAAWVLEKRIVAIADRINPDEMPDVLIPYKAIDLNNFDRYLNRLVRRVKGGEK